MKHTRFTALFVFTGLVLGSHAASADKKLPIDMVEAPLSVMVLGSGGPVATPSGRASAGYLVFVEGQPRILMDAGGGTYQRLAASGANIKDLDIILLSHLHIDHTGDLSPMIKTLYFNNALTNTARTKPIHIYGPAENGVPFPATDIPQYPATTDYAHKHYDLPHGTERYLNIFAGAISGGASTFSYLAHDLNPTVPGAITETVVDAPDGLLVEAIAVDHGPAPAVAFRISYRGHIIAYSGDTRSTGPNMVTIAQDADLLIYDTAITDDLPPNPVFHALHTSPTRMGEVATAANVKTLVLSHITPVTESRLKAIKDVIHANGFQGKVKTATDLKVYNLGDSD